MQLVDEKDNLAFLGSDLLQDGFQALFKFAAEFRPSDERTEIERHQLLAAQAFRHVTVNDALGKAFGNRRLADAGLADQNRIVLGTPGQDLHGAANFLVPPDHGINLSFTDAFSQVGRIFFQRIVEIFCCSSVRPAALTHLFDRTVQQLRVDPSLRQRVGRRRAGRHAQRQ